MTQTNGESQTSNLQVQLYIGRWMVDCSWPVDGGLQFAGMVFRRSGLFPLVGNANVANPTQNHSGVCDLSDLFWNGKFRYTCAVAVNILSRRKRKQSLEFKS